MQMIRALAFCLVATWLTADPASAQEEAEAPESPPTPACTTDASPYRDFDFWVGDWEVYEPGTDRKLGDNPIELTQDGCLIVERWTGARGTTGMSMNFYDPLVGAWRQVWQSPWGFIDYTGGLDDEGRMVLEGKIHYNGRGTTHDFRGRWTPVDDGTVLQEFWQRNEETGEWDSWFVGEYRPRPESPSAAQPATER